MSEQTKIMVIPCSGIGKAFGSIGREATYIAVEDLRPEATATVCLSLLVMGDESTRARVRNQPCISVDGCPTGCARKNIELAGGHVAHALRVIDTYKRHHDLKPVQITELDEAGRQLASLVAEEIVQAIDAIQEAQR
jgi:uncharacterized metal-binding protein